MRSRMLPLGFHSEDHDWLGEKGEDGDVVDGVRRCAAGELL